MEKGLLRLNSRKDMIRDYLDEYMIKALKVEDSEAYSLNRVQCEDLLLPERIDVVAKYMFLLFEVEDIKSDFAEKVYRDHLRAFSLGEFSEPGNDSKNCYEDYVKCFIELYIDIKKNGFDANKSRIPIDKKGIPFNGGHRCAIALLLNEAVETIRLDNRQATYYDYQYFMKRKVKPKYIDFLALNYLKLSKKELYTVCLWPKAVSRGMIPEVEKYISGCSKIVYKKSVLLSKHSLKLLMQQVYGNQDWIGNPGNNFNGIYGKVNECYDDCETIFFFIEGGSLNEILALKEKIRALYGIDKNSVHITDTKNEAIDVANILLNYNTVHFLKYGNPNKIDYLMKDLKEKTSMKEDVIVHPSLTLSLFGNDIYDKNSLFFNISDVQEDVFYDPRNYMFYQGVRFFSPELAAKYMPQKYNAEFKKILLCQKERKIDIIKNSLAYMIYLIKSYMIIILKRLNLIDFVYKIIKGNR